ncbi:MAG: 6-phosphogluconolactonase, partial [Limisphaera sp.]|nr:6-phosphogluconolactonase [Limisphaera sp.]
MKIVVCKNKEELGQRAAAEGAAAIRRALQRRKHARIIVATGASQFEMLSALVKEELAWHRVTAFHLDEYVGLPITHPASF